eukprot:1136938-Pelagomonas_calceolata.AAC.1
MVRLVRLFQEGEMWDFGSQCCAAKPNPAARQQARTQKLPECPRASGKKLVAQPLANMSVHDDALIHSYW